MPLSMYRASVPVLLRALDQLSAILDKAEAHAATAKIEPAALVQARLAPDMLTLAGQVQRASDSAKGTAARLSGVANPSFADDETSFAELQARIAKTRAFLAGIDAALLEDSAERMLDIKLGAVQRAFRGDDYLLGFGLPNFFFHITTAYDILRHNGVPIGKMDYLGNFD
jgi:hypothetical protein